jgi:hypothetical protein
VRVWLIIGFLLLPGVVMAQSAPPAGTQHCSDELRTVKLQLLIADATIQEQAKAFQAADRTLRHQVSEQWGQALGRAETLQQRVGELEKASQTPAGPPGGPPPAP